MFISVASGETFNIILLVKSVSFLFYLLSHMEYVIVKEKSYSLLFFHFGNILGLRWLNFPWHALFMTCGWITYMHALVVDVQTSAQHMYFDPLPLCPLCPLRTNQKQPEGNLPRGRRARKPQTGLPKWDGPFKRGRQRQPHCPSEAHVRGSPRLPRDPGYAAVRHGQEEGGLPGASEAEIPPSCLSDHGPPGKAARAGQWVERGLGVQCCLFGLTLLRWSELKYKSVVSFI